MGVSVQTLVEYGEMHRRHIPESANNCGMINSRLATDLDADGIEYTFRTAHPIGNGRGTTPHNFLYISAGEVYVRTEEGKQRYITAPVILDAALDQFNRANVEDSDTDISLALGGAATATDLPTVALASPERGKLPAKHAVEYSWYTC